MSCAHDERRLRPRGLHDRVRHPHRLRGAHAAARPGAVEAGAAPGSPVDVTPRDVEERPQRRRRSPAMYGVLVLIVVAIGFVLFQGLNSAALYYRNADEAVREKSSLGTRRF